MLTVKVYYSERYNVHRYSGSLAVSRKVVLVIAVSVAVTHSRPELSLVVTHSDSTQEASLAM